MRRPATTRCYSPPKAAISAWLFCACASSIQRPALIEQLAQAYIDVPYPPPAPRIEVVPPAPRADLCWVDGYYTWQGRYYWVKGGWIDAPPGKFFSPSQLMYTRDGRILFAPAAWFDAQHRPVQPPKVLAYARPNVDESRGPTNNALATSAPVASTSFESEPK